MFTGLIQAMGEVARLSRRGTGVEMEVRVPAWGGKLVLGESIAVSGCCLTVESVTSDSFTVFASPETMAKTSLGDRQTGDAVNLERALALGDRLGGHMVSGHVDTTGRLRSVTPHDQSWELWFEAPATLLTESVPKGSIAVDGISLTLVEVTPEAFSVWIIPETWARTTLARTAIGARVNLESDLIGKYVRRSVEAYLASGGRLEDVARRFGG
jgi:riboflavin synthase